jgi:hypothetical protein
MCMCMGQVGIPVGTADNTVNRRLSTALYVRWMVRWPSPSHCVAEDSYSESNVVIGAQRQAAHAGRAAVCTDVAVAE